MSRLETEFAGVRMRNPLILSSATPSWDGAHCREAWPNEAGVIVPKSFAPPVKFAQHPRCGRMKIIRGGKRPVGMINIELYTTVDLADRSSCRVSGRLGSWWPRPPRLRAGTQ